MRTLLRSTACAADHVGLRRSATVGAVVVAALMFAPDAVLACEAAGEDVRAVAGVSDALTIQVEAGAEVRLAGILAPTSLDAGVAGADWAPAHRAKAALEELVAGGRIVLATAGRRTDRYGRIATLVFVGRGDSAERIWVQGELVRRGHARVIAMDAAQPCVAELMQREIEARTAGAGLWADPAYVVRRAEDVGNLSRLTGAFQIVEGRVVAASQVRDQLYLNFGEDWRRDFTILVRPQARRGLQAMGVSPTELKGAHIRVRGWIERRGGPLIDVTDARAIEMLTEEVEAAPVERRVRRRARRPAAADGGP